MKDGIADGPARRGTAADMAVLDAPSPGCGSMDMTDQGVFEAAKPEADTLLAACRQRAAEARREIAQVTEALAGTWRGPLTDRQRAQVGNMLGRLLAGIEATLRQELAARLETREDLPRESVAAFGFASSADAHERLAKSGLLLEPALVEAALHRVFEHMLETALRPSVADPWQPYGDVAAVPALAAAGADDRALDDALAGYLVERAQRADSYGEPVLRLDELNDTLVERLHWRVAALLRGRSAAIFAVAPGSLDGEVQQAVRAALEAFAQRVTDRSATARAATALAQAGALDGALLLDVLRHAEVPLFLGLFAALARLRPRLLRRLVFEPEGIGLAVAARCGGLTADQLAAIFRLTRHARAPARAGPADDVPRLVALFGRIDAETAAQVRAYWRLPADYLDALWRVGAATGAARTAGC